MSSRVKVYIKDLGKVITGHTPPTKERRFYGDKYVFIKPTDIDENSRFVQQVEEKLSEEGYNKYKNAILPPLTPCMVTIGSLGKKMCITKDWSFTNQAINAVIVNKKHNSMYVYYLFRTLLPTVKLLSNGTASGRENVSKSSFEQIEISIPNRIEQDKIAYILSSYDNLIENNKRRIAILEEMAQRLYREWFVDFRFPGHESVNVVESEVGKIPEGWKFEKVGDICEKIFSGGTPTTTINEYWNGTLPWLSSGETRNAFIIDTEKKITDQGVDNSSTKKANTKDVVIASAGQGKTRGQTSYLLIDTYINQSVIALRGKRNVSEYLFFNIRSRYPELRNASDSSSIRGSITTVFLSSLDIIVPTDELLKKFSERAALVIEQIGVLQRKNNTLSKTRDLLLPRLMSGDIDVSDIDVPVLEAY